MGKKFRSIKEINMKWVRKKEKYDPMPRYAGIPELLIGRAFIPLSKESLAEIKRNQN